jgi:hypothetical protein
VTWQTGIGPIHQATQLGAAAFKLEAAAEQLHPYAGRRWRPLVERVGRYFRRSSFLGAHAGPSVMQE